jgi:hypothetical protein
MVVGGGQKDGGQMGQKKRSGEIKNTHKFVLGNRKENLLWKI